jgi:hypothetical protein
VQLASGAREPGTLHVVVVENSLGFELVIAVRAMAAVAVLVIVMTAAVNDVLPTKVSGNEKLSGMIVICDKVACTPAPDIAIETLPVLVVLIVI